MIERTGDLPIPVFPGFVIEREIGRGGMAVVYEALQVTLQRTVALKVMDPVLARNSEFVRRFHQEAQAVASLKHPNVVTVHDIREADKQIFIVMEYIEGFSLRDVLLETGGWLEVPSAIHVLTGTARGLAYVHSRGTIHRDVKPGNILLGEGGKVTISDFGLAGLLDRSAEGRLTRENVVMGTVDYMAPEQREDTRSVDHRADLYSFGVMAYELLTGHLPQGAWRPAGQLVKSIDKRLDDLILRCLERDPEDRLQDAEEAVEILQVVEADRLAVPSVPPGPVDREAETNIWSDDPSSSESIDLALARLAHRDHPTMLLADPVKEETLPAAPPVGRSGTAMWIGCAALAAGAFLAFARPGPLAVAPTPAPPPTATRVALIPIATPELRPPPLPLPPRNGSLLLTGKPPGFRFRLLFLDVPGAASVECVAGERIEELNPGRYQVSLRAEGYAPRVEELQIRTAQDLRVDFRLEALPPPLVRMALEASPADTEVDCPVCPGGLRRLGPLGGHRDLELPPGSYRFHFSRAGFLDYLEEVTLVAGSPGPTLRVELDPVPPPPPTRRVLQPTRRAPPPTRAPTPSTPTRRVPPEPRTGTLVVETVPSGVEILVDGKSKGSSPLTLEVPSGSRRIQLGLRGFVTETHALQVEIGRTSRLRHSMIRQMAALDVTSDPAGARVLIDGKSVGNTPLLGKKFPVGKVRIVVKLAGYDDWVGTQTLEIQEHVRVRAVFQHPWTRSGLKETALEGHKGGVSSLAWDPDAGVLASGGMDNLVRIWDPVRGRAAARPFSGHSNDVVALTARGRRLVSSDRSRRVRPVYLPGGNLLKTMIEDLRNVSQALALSPDGRSLMIGSRDRTCVRFDLGNWRLESTYRGHRGWVTGLAFDPTGAEFVSGSKDRTLRIWQVSNPRRARAILTGHTGEVNAVAWSPAGNRIASCGASGGIRLWDAGSGKLLRLLTGHQGGVNALGFSPDGGLLVTGGSDGTVKVWLVSTGKELRTIRSGQGAVRAVTFLSSERWIAAAGADGSVRVWERKS